MVVAGVRAKNTFFFTRGCAVALRKKEKTNRKRDRVCIATKYHHVGSLDRTHASTRRNRSGSAPAGASMCFCAFSAERASGWVTPKITNDFGEEAFTKSIFVLLLESLPAHHHQLPQKNSERVVTVFHRLQPVRLHAQLCEVLVELGIGVARIGMREVERAVYSSRTTNIYFGLWSPK